MHSGQTPHPEPAHPVPSLQLRHRRLHSGPDLVRLFPFVGLLFHQHVISKAQLRRDFQSEVAPALPRALSLLPVVRRPHRAFLQLRALSANLSIENGVKRLLCRIVRQYLVVDRRMPFRATHYMPAIVKFKSVPSHHPRVHGTPVHWRHQLHSPLLNYLVGALSRRIPPIHIQLFWKPIRCFQSLHHIRIHSRTVLIS